LWRLIGDVGIGGAPLLAGPIVKAAGLGEAGVLVMAFAVRETLRGGHEQT